MFLCPKFWHQKEKERKEEGGKEGRKEGRKGRREEKKIVNELMMKTKQIFSSMNKYQSVLHLTQTLSLESGQKY